MADLVAYAAYRHLVRLPLRVFAWEWCERYLMPYDVNDGPIEL